MPFSTTTTTTTSSKLGYLSKYTSKKGVEDDDDEDGNRHKKDKKSKKKKDKKMTKTKKQDKTTRRRDTHREFDNNDNHDKQQKEAGLLWYDSDDNDEKGVSAGVRKGSRHNVDNNDEDDEDPWMDDPDNRPVVVPLSDEVVVGISHDDGEKGPAATIMTTRPRGVWEELPLDCGGNAVSTVRTSSTTTTASTTTKTFIEKEDSPLRPRRRYDSSEDESPPPRPPSPRRSPSSPSHDSRTKRRRYDSDEDEDPPNTVPTAEASSPVLPGGSSTKRRRYDSEESSHEKVPERLLRRRYDSDDENESESKPVKQEEDKDSTSRRRRRHDSESSETAKDDGSKARMSSGHKAGLQDYSEFNKEEAKIQTRKKQEAQLMVDKYGVGETVYRKGSGAGQGPQKKKFLELDALQQAQLNLGKVQRDQALARSQEFQELQESAFARHQDDQGLEAIRKNQIRQGDPMAAYAMKKRGQSKHRDKKSKQKGISQDDVVEEKPIYKGPPPKPNRHGIRPGYRWDGVDRGNGFEDKLLAKQYSANLKNEEEYRWRSADM